MQLFYFPNITPTSNQAALDRMESKHVIKVLRKNVGDILDITDGKGNHYHGIIQLANPNNCLLSLTHIAFHKKQKPSLTMAVAPTKLNDRYEWFLEKATEIGIDIIVPILCQHSERKVIKRERFNKVLISAMKQSNQFWLPQLEPLTSFKNFMASDRNTLKLIAHCEENEKNPIRMALGKEDTSILIGPEGDFCPKEIQAALDLGYTAVSLGETRLRTETAAVYATVASSLYSN